MTILSGQSVISRVYTSRFGNGTGSHGASTEVVLKKYQVPGTVPSGKPPKSEPYRTVPCRTMQWKSAIRLSCPPTLPPWDLALVLGVLALPRFETLQTVSSRELSLKTALLLALGLGDCNVTCESHSGFCTFMT